MESFIATWQLRRGLYPPSLPESLFPSCLAATLPTNCLPLGVHVQREELRFHCKWRMPSTGCSSRRRGCGTRCVSCLKDVCKCDFSRCTREGRPRGERQLRALVLGGPGRCLRRESGWQQSLAALRLACGTPWPPHQSGAGDPRQVMEPHCVSVEQAPLPRRVQEVPGRGMGEGLAAEP